MTAEKVLLKRICYLDTGFSLENTLWKTRRNLVNIRLCEKEDNIIHIDFCNLIGL